MEEVLSPTLPPIPTPPLPQDKYAHRKMQEECHWPRFIPVTQLALKDYSQFNFMLRNFPEVIRPANVNFQNWAGKKRHAALPLEALQNKAWQSSGQ